MENNDLETTLELPCYLKSFLWFNDYCNIFSLVDTNFFIYDIQKKKYLEHTEHDIAFSSFFYEENEAKFYCGSFLANRIDSYDMNKQQFSTILNEDHNDNKSAIIKLHKNLDGTVISITKRSKETSLNIYDFRQSKNLLFSQIFPFRVLNHSDLTDGLLGISWKENKTYSHTLFDVNQIWPNEKNLEKELRHEMKSKLKSEEFDINQEITSLRISPSKSLLSCGRSNGNINLYEIEKDNLNICKKTQIFLATHSHYEEQPQNSKEPGKLPARPNYEVVDMDFMPMKIKQKKEKNLVSSGKEGALKLMNFEKRKFIKKIEFEKSGKFTNGHFSNIKLNPKGNILMVLKRQDLETTESYDTVMKFIDLPIKYKAVHKN